MKIKVGAGGALRAAADFLRDVHDSVDGKAPPPRRQRRPRSLCHCQICTIKRLEDLCR